MSAFDAYGYAVAFLIMCGGVSLTFMTLKSVFKK